MYHVYLLKSKKDNNYYIGQTDDVQARLKKHNSGEVRSTKPRRPFILIGYEDYKAQRESRWREYQLKNSPNIKKKFIEKLLKDYENRNQK